MKGVKGWSSVIRLTINPIEGAHKREGFNIPGDYSINPTKSTAASIMRVSGRSDKSKPPERFAGMHEQYMNKVKHKKNDSQSNSGSAKKPGISAIVH
jgi:hypothetical protein